MILILGGYIGIATLWLFHHYLQDGRPEQVRLAQTIAFTGIIILEKMNVFNYRALRAPLSVIGFFSNRWVLLVWTLTVGLQVCAVYVPFLQRALHTIPLGWEDWAVILGPLPKSLDTGKIDLLRVLSQHVVGGKPGRRFCHAVRIRLSSRMSAQACTFNKIMLQIYQTQSYGICIAGHSNKGGSFGIGLKHIFELVISHSLSLSRTNAFTEGNVFRYWTFYPLRSRSYRNV